MAVIREMSQANPLWGAPRIHGELLKLDIDLGQPSVAEYMARRRWPPSQGWTRRFRGLVQAVGRILPTPILRGLHAHYVRI
jgi:hypothetical protein